MRRRYDVVQELVTTLTSSLAPPVLFRKPPGRANPPHPPHKNK